MLILARKELGMGIGSSALRQLAVDQIGKLLVLTPR